jgi:hypothetical protein
MKLHEPAARGIGIDVRGEGGSHGRKKKER